MRKYMTIQEAADALGVSSQTLRNWEKAGELIPYRNPINKYRMYKVSQIESFIEEMRNERLKKSRFKLTVKIEQEKKFRLK
ncbi:helix-turn-helix domain-containing protein [Patescibacteria group bacterium]|nr:helix-turn-helix domain-containing protein [Patescibacteria group bacterium]